MRSWANGTWLLSSSDPFDKLDPARDYQLVFCGVGGQFIVQLYDLTDGTQIAEHREVDPEPLSLGWIGFRVNQNGSSQSLDFTLDNFIVVGTTPITP
jgi:hypothetical protein